MAKGGARRSMVNMSYPSREIVADLRRAYPEGARVELIAMDDIQAPPAGTLGTVRLVDDIGSIHVKWDNGSGLAIAYGVDQCRKIKGGTE